MRRPLLAGLPIAHLLSVACLVLACLLHEPLPFRRLSSTSTRSTSATTTMMGMLAVQGQMIHLPQNRSIVHLSFSSSTSSSSSPAAESALGSLASSYTTFSLAFSGQVKDRWLPQIGPAPQLVPTDCAPTASQTGCIGPYEKPNDAVNY
jgi:hypothetical protein